MPHTAPHNPLASCGMTRREAVRLGSSAAAAAALTPLRAVAQTAQPKARSVIQIWMWGGPPHTDTFDPKPDTGYDYCGPLDKAIGTNVDGIQIGQSLPQLAQLADQYSILRGMTHGINGHETASYMVQTGREPGDGQVYPAVGAVVSLKKGYDAGYTGLIPPYIVVTQPQGRFSESGFMGLKYKPFATGGNPADRIFTVEGIVARGITRERQVARRHLLEELDRFSVALRGDPLVAQMEASREQAYELILGEAGKVFDLSTEPDALRDRYGRNKFGQSCLLARKLVEQGVPYITINYEGWDTHKTHFSIMQRKLPELDRGLATLLSDLADHGLLESTVVWWGGEFGRTPKIDWEPPWNGGRHHYGKAFCALLAGGGFRGGQVVGATCPHGETVTERPIYPVDMIGSIYDRLGIDPASALPHPQGLDVRLVPDMTDDVQRGGLLREIMI